MQKPLSNPFRPAASRNLKPSSQTDGFAWSAVSETNFHHAIDNVIAILVWPKAAIFIYFSIPMGIKEQVNPMPMRLIYPHGNFQQRKSKTFPYVAIVKRQYQETAVDCEQTRTWELGHKCR